MREILRVRLTHNVKQLKKYVDKAISKGAETITFDMDKSNPYFLFYADFTPEQENEFEIQKLKKEFEEKLKVLESRRYKTHSFRIDGGKCKHDNDKLISIFNAENKIKEYFHPVIKKVITDEYDDFEDGKETVFITEIL